MKKCFVTAVREAAKAMMFSLVLLSPAWLAIAIPDCSNPCSSTAQAESVDILIVGGGISGIAAANVIDKQSDKTFKVLEAGERLGGRIKSEMFEGTRIELGANWVTGGGQNPILGMAWQYQIDYEQQNFLDWDWTTYAPDRNSAGGIIGYSLQKRSRVKKIQNDLAAAYSCLSSEASVPNVIDVGAESVITGDVCEYENSGDVEKSALWYALNWEFGDAASQVSLMSLNGPEYRDFNPQSYLVFDQYEGYEGIVNNYANELQNRMNDVKLNAEVHCIDFHHSDGNYPAKIHAVESGQCKEYLAKKVISTVSVGVLTEKRDSIFKPALPLDKVTKPWYMGLYYKVFVKFTQKFWEDAEFINTATDPPGFCSLWLNMDLSFLLPGSKMLVCTVTKENIVDGNNVLDFDSAQINDFLEPLKLSYTGKEVEMVNYKVYEWGKDPLTYGSYENWRVGGTVEEFNNFRAPMSGINGANNVVHISGSATCFRYWGYVHGGYEGGKCTARRVLAELGVNIDTTCICDDGLP